MGERMRRFFLALKEGWREGGRNIPIVAQPHGTSRGERWDWPSRGYTPAGTEVWNAMRALDYLETRPDVDATRVGMQGISMGGYGVPRAASGEKRIAAALMSSGSYDLKSDLVDQLTERRDSYTHVVATSGRVWFLSDRSLMVHLPDKDSTGVFTGVPVQMTSPALSVMKLVV